MLLLLCSFAWSHGEHEIPRYVAAQGKDTGDCELPVRPCRTIQYAQSVAGKGDRLLIAAGTYPIRTAQDIFMFTSGMLDVQGGFDRFDHFARQSPDANQTTLVGVPVEFRQQLRDQGIPRRGGPERAAAEAARSPGGVSLRLRRHAFEQRPGCLQQRHGRQSG